MNLLLDWQSWRLVSSLSSSWITWLHGLERTEAFIAPLCQHVLPMTWMYHVIISSAKDKTVWFLLVVFLLFHNHWCSCILHSSPLEFILCMLSNQMQLALWKGVSSYEKGSLNITIRGHYHLFRNNLEYLSLSTVLFWRHWIPLRAEKPEIIQPQWYNFS